MTSILITHVHDKARFINYSMLKFELTIYAAIDIIRRINCDNRPIKINNLPECDIKYLKEYVTGYRYKNHLLLPIHICDLKIINNEPRKFKKKIMPSTNITDNKPQEQSSLELYNVSYTKMTNYCESLTKHQIDVLLKDPSVKSINIKK